MRNILTILSLIIWFNSFGQENYLKIENISNKEDFNFPTIYSTDTLTSEKINIHLQLSELDLIKGKERKNIFEVVTENSEGIYGSKTSINYEILNNNERVLTLCFDESSCGMTCAYWNRYYNFNPQNGNRYFLQDFFSEPNFKKIKDLVVKERQRDFERQLTSLKKESQDPELDELKTDIFSRISEDDLTDFYFNKDSLFFDSWNLLDKNAKFLGFETVTGIAIKQIQNLLNDYGKAILISGQGIVNYQGTTNPQLFEGIIGKHNKIYLLFRNLYENTFEGTYAYKKYGKAIYLGKGKFLDGTYTFEEDNYNFKKIGTISFKQQGNTLLGYWKNNKGIKLNLKAQKL